MEVFYLGELARGRIQEKSLRFKKVAHGCTVSQLHPIYFWCLGQLYVKVNTGAMYRIDFRYCPDCEACLSLLPETP